MRKSATDAAVEAFATAAAAAKVPTPRPLPIVVYLRSSSVNAICDALMQSADAFLARDEHLRSHWGRMKALAGECRDTGEALHQGMRLSPDHLGLTQVSIEHHKALLRGAADLIAQMLAKTKTSYVVSRLNTCTRLLVTATQLLCDPTAPPAAAKAAKKAASKKPAAKKPAASAGTKSRSASGKTR